MTRFFNTAGPNNPASHYTLPALARLPQVDRLIQTQGWFVLHAPRQSGKTTLMRALADELTTSGQFAALWATCEAAEPFRHDPGAAERVVMANIISSAEFDLPAQVRPPPPNEAIAPGHRLAQFLQSWSMACPLPVVLLLDEIDALQDDALLTVLRQLRAIFPRRPEGAPSTVALIGLRDVRDYKMRDASSGHLGTSSPFNVKVASLTLQAFDRDAISTLYGQHSAETGQAFSTEAIDRAFALTGGQPWLVNALAREVVEKLKVEGDIDAAHIDAARERLVLSRATHLDSLADKLREPRVRAVVAPLLTGEPGEPTLPADVDYCVDLGLVRRDPKLGLMIANPIYREVLPRELSVAASDNIPALPQRRWALQDGRLDIDAVLAAFCDFWLQHGEWMVRGQTWPKFAHQIVLMAFLQRLVNGGATIEREYGLGRQRLDLLIRWHVRVGVYGEALEQDRHAIEVKVWRDGRPDPLAQGLVQIEGYLERLGLDCGVLVIFDAREGAPAGDAWGEQITHGEAQTAAGRVVRILRA